MSSLEKDAWQAFRLVVNGLLGNNRSEDYKGLVENFVTIYQAVGCRMSIKLHFVHSHLDFLRTNFRTASEEHGERFHKDIQVMEKRYQGRWDEAMMGDYAWSLIRIDSSQHKRKLRLTLHFSDN